MSNISKETAKSIIASRQKVDLPGEYETSFKLSKQVFEWENDPTQQYRILSTNLTTAKLLAQAKAHYKDNEFNDATNKRLTTRVSLTKAEEIEASRGNIAVVSVDYREDDDNGKFLAIVKPNDIKIIVATKGTKVTLDDWDEEEDQEKITQPSVTTKEVVAGGPVEV